MNCVVTAGPTIEPLDEVRRLTNFSTGRLGSELARHLGAGGQEVLLINSEQTTYQGGIKADRVETFTTTTYLSERLRALSAQGAGAVFHAAAVSDFTFGKVFE